MSLLETLDSLHESDVIPWFIRQVCEQRGFWKWPDLYYVSQEPAMKWWTDTAYLISNKGGRSAELSARTRRRLARDLLAWLRAAAVMNHHEW